MSAEYYTDSAVFELEKKAIFQRTWQYVAPVAQFREIGDFTTLTLFDQNLFVIKGRDGALRAFYNVCGHRAHELVSGSGNGKSSIVCPSMRGHTTKKERWWQHQGARVDLNSTKLNSACVVFD